MENKTEKPTKKNEQKQEFPSKSHDEIKNKTEVTPEPKQESSGSREDSYKAATRGTEIEVHQPHPTKIPHPRDEISR